MNNDEWNFDGEKLHDDGRIRVHASGRDVRAHNVVILENYIFLASGIMNEWARSSPDGIASGYLNVRGVSYELENPDVPIEEFGWALAKARNSELENEVASAYRRISDLGHNR